MEFRNHQHWIRHHSAQLKSSPLAAFLFTLVFLALLVPLIAIGLFAFAAFLILLPFRIAYAQWMLGRAGGGSPPSPPDRTGDVPKPAGPVIDVEVTRSRPGP